MPPATVDVGDTCWQAVGLWVERGQRLLGGSGDACPPPGPGPPTSSPLLQGRLRCSSCSLVSDLLREQWGRLSSDWGQGRLVGLQMAPPWPQQQSGPRDTLALTTSAGIALPCSLDGCLRACFLGGRGSSAQGGRDTGQRCQPPVQGPSGSMCTEPCWACLSVGQGGAWGTPPLSPGQGGERILVLLWGLHLQTLAFPDPGSLQRSLGHLWTPGHSVESQTPHERTAFSLRCPWLLVTG